MSRKTEERIEVFPAQAGGSFPAKAREKTEYGSKYEQEIIVHGLKGIPVKIMVGWIHDDNGTRLITAHLREVDR